MAITAPAELAPTDDRAPDWVATGTPAPLRDALEAALGAEQLLGRAHRPGPLRLGREPLPADPAGGRAPPGHRRRDGAAAAAADLGTSVVFRAGGTSLNGQTQTDAILADVRHHWQRVRVQDGGLSARVQPGATLGLVNRHLARHGRRLGPDPASTNIACVGGVVANNSGGMRCGVTADSYSTVSAMTLVLAYGAEIDTAAPDAEQRFAAAAPELAAGLIAIRDEIRADRRAGGADRAQVRDQEHDRLPAVRVPGCRHAAGDLPPAGDRIGGDAGLRRRGGVRHRAARRAHGARPGLLR